VPSPAGGFVRGNDSHRESSTVLHKIVYSVCLCESYGYDSQWRRLFVIYEAETRKVVHLEDKTST